LARSGEGVGPPAPTTTLPSFGDFYRENYGLVLSVAEHRLSSLADAEEVASETFRVAFQAYQEGRELTVPWIYGVVRNLVGNEYRRRTRHTALLDRLETEHLIAPYVDARPGVDDLVEALELLPEAQRELLKMAYWDELTMAEIAGVLDSSEGAIRVRVFRARKSLVRALVRVQLRHRRKRREVMADGA